MSLTIHTVQATVEDAPEDYRAEVNRELVDRVEWIEEAAQLIGSIGSRSCFLAHTFDTLGRGLPRGTRLEVQSVCVASEYAVVTLCFQPSANAELEPAFRYRWICRFARAPLSGS